MGKRTYTVYVHESPDGKKYVGVTSTTIEERSMNGAGYSANEAFWKDIKKYGWNKFKHIVVAEGLSCKEAAQMERDLIEKYHSTFPAFGYNKTKGGETREMYNPEREKLVLLSMRFSEEERDQLKHDAYKHNMNVSEYVRWLIVEQRKRDGKK